MTYKEKSIKFKELVFYCQHNNDSVLIHEKKRRWKDLQELDDYFNKFGGKIKYDLKRRKGYIVSFLYQDKKRRTVAAELPKDFVEKALVLNGLP